MKKQLKSLLLVVVFAGILFPQRLHAQASTEGKEFWVALIPSKSPAEGEDPSSNGFASYIAISAPKACSVRVSNPNSNPAWSQTYTIQNDNSWLEIKDIPLDQWYSNSMPASEQVLNKGIKVEATEEVSVYTCLRWDYSMDATNNLPVTALQSEYIVQTYGPSNNDGIKRNVFSVLAAEDCIVDITLTAQTEGGRTNTISNLSLKAGQVYHVRSAENESLNGSRVVARNGKKIAVFAGCPLGNIPNNFTDRDLVYEQLFPVDYWGENFIVVRSKEKDANRVIITAQNDNTDVTIYGHYDPSNDKTNAPHTTLQNYSLTLQAGESYEFEMSIGYAADSRDPEPEKRWDNKRKESLNGVTFVDSTVYISTSCPCAVLSYDVGNSYLRKDAGKETVSFKKPGKDNPQNYGAPAMTWIAPIEQMMNDVVFGVMGTDKTDRHFVNIIVPQAGVNTATMNGRSLSSYFHPVESNPSYYYARITLPKTVSGTPNPFYRLQCDEGFTATVYGNGDDESYAYTVGSSTIKRAIKINEHNVYEEGSRDTKHKYCIGDFLTFDAQVGTDEVSRVDWDFGDGTTGSGVQNSHMYSSPGWYDVKADIYGHQACTDVAEQFLGTVLFTIRVWKPQCIEGNLEKRCLTLEEQNRNPDSCAQLLQKGNVVERVLVDSSDCASDTLLNIVSYKLETKEEFDQTERDSAFVFGKWYFSSQEGLQDTILNSDSCNHVRICNLTIITCLDLDIENDSAAQHPCRGDSLIINYTKNKGDINNSGNIGDTVLFICNNGKQGVMDTIPVKLSGGSANTSGTLTLPTSTLEPGIYKAKIVAVDYYCGDTIEYPIDITVYYPSDIFKAKFGNSLSVYNPGYGGNKINPDKKDGDANNGWKFVAYQWYKDDQKIDSLTAQDPLYYTPYNEEGRHIKLEGVYYVELTREDGVKLKSCSQTFIDGKHPETKPAPAAQDEEQNDSASSNTAQKILQNRQIRILRDGHTYNIYGQKVD